MTMIGRSGVHRRKWLLRAAAALVVLAGAALFAFWRSGRPFCVPTFSPEVTLEPTLADERPLLSEIPIPAAADWVDYGPVLEVGPPGSWDFIFAGATPGSVVKKEGTYYFYYVAADGYRSHDGDARHRSIGVATSPDGVRFEKHEGSPIMTHAPFDGEEEGANSAAITLDQDGNFIMFYGAAAGPADIIVADGRVAVSQDGLSFVDQARVLDHCDVSLYGFGDEIFPQAAFRDGENWTVFYQPNGAFPAARTLGLAAGPQIDRLPNSFPVLEGEDGIKPVGVWGNVNRLSAEEIVLFVQKDFWPNTFVEVRTAAVNAPHLLSEPLARIDIPNLKRGTVFLDRERRTWFMYYNDFSRHWHLKLAPAGEPDLTPPTVPGSLTAETAAYDRINLSWKAAEDEETGVVHYRVYREGMLLGTTIESEFVDRGLRERQQVTYEVRAVNFHGVEGEAAVVVGQTPADQKPPRMLAAVLNDMGDRLEITFDEPVEPQSAENPPRYTISPDLPVLAAVLDGDGRRVFLETAAHRPGTVYELRAAGIRDLAPNRNELVDEQRVTYRAAVISEPLADWRFNIGLDDLSGYSQPSEISGAVLESGQGGPWLSFDGQDDYLFIPNNPTLETLTAESFTFSVRVRPESRPQGRAAALVVRVGGFPDHFFGLLYTAEGRFAGQVIDETGEVIEVRSSPQTAGEWRDVAFVVDHETARMTLYIDGDLVGEAALTLPLADLNRRSGDPSWDGPFYIGSTWPDKGTGSFYDRYFHGHINGLTLYNRALTQEEIGRLARDGGIR